LVTEVRNFGPSNSQEIDYHWDLFSPNDGKFLVTSFSSSETMVKNSVEYAIKNAENWRNTTPPNRGLMLRNFVKNIEIHQKELINLVCIETGKSIEESKKELIACVEMGYFMASQGRRLYGITTSSVVPKKRVSTWRLPVGVCALIVSANTPLPNYQWKVFPALICGNSVILKPSEYTPLSSTYFVKLAIESGIPKPTFQLLHGHGNTTGKYLVESKVDLISFTGSKNSGLKILNTTKNTFKKVSLELGGKNPIIILNDSNIDLAVESVIVSAFSNAGQRCAAASRLIIEKEVYNKIIRKLINKVNELESGNEHANQIGPLINPNSIQYIDKILNKSLNNGAVILAKGKNFQKNGNYFAPILLGNVDRRDEITYTELFGPILCVYKANNLDEAIKLANDTNYGLTAAIWTNNISKAHLVSRKLECGMVTLNGNSFGAEVNMPFGGFKDSGNGWKENGDVVLDIYSTSKTIVENELEFD